MRRPPRLSKPMRPSEVAALLGFTGPWARDKVVRHLRKLEEQTGVTLMTKMGGGRATRYVIHLSVLREHHPALFYRRDEAMEALREYVEEWDERVVGTNDRIDTLARIISDKIQKLEARVAHLERLAKAGTP